MASAYLNVVKNGLSSGNTDIYVCPTGGQAIIKVVNIYNTTAGAVITTTATTTTATAAVANTTTSTSKAADTPT